MRADSATAEQTPNKAHGEGADEPSDLPAELRERFAAALGIPFTEGNRIEPLVNGCRIFPAMLSAIDEAESSIEFLTFVYWTGDVADQFAEALAGAAKRGVTVRVLLDAYGARPMDDRLLDKMRSAGVDVQWFRPLARLKLWRNDHRTHRKVLICDQRVGFTGGVGIAREWEGDAQDPDHWRETHFRVRGPAVAGLRSAFIGNWVEAGRDLIDDCDPTQTPPEDESRGARSPGDALVQTIRSTASIKWSDAFLIQRLLIRAARRSLRITSAYFVPSGPTVRLLCGAAERGVDTHILMPGPHMDERLCKVAGEDVFRPLLEAGVHLHTYQPTMLHAKVITVDGTIALLGSANFNNRSAQKDDELCLVVIDEALVAELDRHWEDDLKRAEAVKLDGWKNRSWWRKAGETLVRPIRGEL